MHLYLLHQLLTRSAERYPDREAVVLNNESLNYADLESKSSQLALSLEKTGVRPGHRVGILLNKSIESIISVFGILKAGATYVPIDPLSPVSRMHHIMNNCGIECAITSSAHLAKITESTEYPIPLRKVLVVDRDLEATDKREIHIDTISWSSVTAESPDKHQPVQVADVSPAYILHTSGSTGMPKGVAISHLNALAFVQMAADFFAINERDRFAGFAPLHFDLSVFDIFAAVKMGASIVLVPEFLSTFPIKLAEYIENKGVSIWNSASSALCLLADRGKLDRFPLDSLRLIHFSGDIMPVKYLRLLMTNMKNAAFYNIYGQTEANSSMCCRIEDIPGDEAWKIPIGKPFPNFEVFALTEEGELVDRPGQRGELYVKSATVALGYWNDEEKTNEKFMQDPRASLPAPRVYRTGDLVEIDRRNDYLFVGRKDHMVKSRGYRIELSEIEAVLHSHALVRQAVVLAVPDSLIGNRIVAHVGVLDGTGLSKADLDQFCSNVLPKYMIPEVIFFHDALPLSSSGKIDRKQLEKLSSIGGPLKKS